MFLIGIVLPPRLLVADDIPVQKQKVNLTTDQKFHKRMKEAIDSLQFYNNCCKYNIQPEVYCELSNESILM